MNLRNYLPASVLAYEEEAIRVRRTLHQIPEEGFKEVETQAWLLAYLRDLGYEPETVVGTGVALFIPGIEGSEDETIAFRADMDGLSVVEPETTVYRSRHEGMMHACGHDGHMTMLCLLAKYLADHKEARRRNVLLIFQPAEEGPGGAKPVAESGILEKYHVGAIFGYHVFPFIEKGVIATSPGPIIAMNSEIYIDVSGKSSHAANPDQGIDAIVAASKLVLGIREIAGTRLNPRTESVIHIGTFNGGSRMNVVSDHVALTGTMRSYDEAIHQGIQQRIRAIAQGIEAMDGVSVEVKFIDMYPPVVNDGALYRKVWPLLGDDKARAPFKRQMIAEDFAFYGKYRPSLFMGLGTANPEKGYTSGLHTSTFNFDELVLLRGLEADLAIIGADGRYSHKIFITS